MPPLRHLNHEGFSGRAEVGGGDCPPSHTYTYTYTYTYAQPIMASNVRCPPTFLYSSQASLSLSLLERSSFTPQSSCQIHVADHDGHPLGVDGAEVGIFEQPHHVGFAGLLQGQDSLGLESVLLILLCGPGDLANQTLKGELLHQQVGALLVLSNLAKSNCTTTERSLLLFALITTGTMRTLRRHATVAAAAEAHHVGRGDGAVRLVVNHALGRRHGSLRGAEGALPHAHGAEA
mmetsp:Transcript_12929/g.19584  ORF Transcript_12929/g.19584 Transcript_12929/m.19584 type:complete len:234 (+) Transcript_12929:417-1118(+)